MSELKYPKLYIHDGGGVGDVLRCQLQGKKGWGYIEPLKEKYPEVFIRAIITSCNPQAFELIKHHPFIDEKIKLQWKHPHQKWPDRHKYAEDLGFVRLTCDTGRELFPGLKKAPIPPLYLSDKDQGVVKEIQATGDYVFVHPFSGVPWRIGLLSGQYPVLIDRLIDELGLNVVVVGGTYKKDYPKGHAQSQQLIEEVFEYERDGLFNLVNKSNVRVCAQLARDSKYAITTWSCYARSAWHGSTTAVTLYSGHPYNPPVERLAKHGKLIKIPQDPNKRKMFSFYTNQVFDWIRQNNERS